MATKIYRNLVEIDKDVKIRCKTALKNTLKELIDDLYDFIEHDIYDAHTPKFYNRTNVLRKGNQILQQYIWNNFSGDSLGGGIKFNENKYYSKINIEKFQHGSTYRGGTHKYQWQDSEASVYQRGSSFYYGKRSRTEESHDVLSFPSYLEIMNGNYNSSKPNPYNFPVIHRRSFLEDFKRYADANFYDIYTKHLEYAMGKHRANSSDSTNKNKSMNLSHSTSQYSSVGTHNVSYDDGIGGNVYSDASYATDYVKGLGVYI